MAQGGTMALPDTIHLEVVTPDRQIFSGDVDAIVVPARQGYMGILPGHAPLLAELGIGEISIQTGADTDYMFCSWGFLEVLPDRVVLLAQTAEMASDIDVKRAEEAKERAEKMLSSQDPGTDFRGAELALMQAISRLNAAHRLIKKKQPRSCLHEKSRR
jgi:F-type H+-transporting ATPase subunit epsilon